ncbi:hypothetical protein DBR47_13865 [Paucibacter sp. KBW04]|uniref:hypothetical protein n=1 Tax=Paucibacter sp. KBW04 TaxID=2153361 RepID=UPI000F58CC3A|nr:hypothetical protein [Paucibacter sp. KBW04]RQO58754.1 hypothetical protein DBR47_13865 [Paucibacter sp. KBW04]
MKTRPYIIITPSYCVSAGVRVMHSLCHELNSLGFDAKLLITSNLSRSPAEMLNPALNTPCINGYFEQNWEAINQDAIVICADGFRGHPFNAKRVVRYVLGKEILSPEDNPSDYRVYYSRAFPAQRAGKHPVLYLTPIDLGRFNANNVLERSQDMLWLGKGAKFCTEKPANCVDITYSWPPTREELAENLRRTRTLYSYDAVSATNLEAVLCGATVVLKHLSYHDWSWSRADMEAMEQGTGGFAFGDSDFELDRAERTRAETMARIRFHQANFKARLLDFVEATQYRFRD